MRVMALIMEGGVPTEVSGRDIHGGGNFVAVGAEQIPPRLRVIVTEALGVLSLEGDDVRPDVAWVLAQLCHCFFKVNDILVTEQSMAAQPLYPRPGSDVLHIGFGLVHFRPVAFQRRGYEL